MSAPGTPGGRSFGPTSPGRLPTSARGTFREKAEGGAVPISGMTPPPSPKCPGCGGPLPTRHGRGRPRKFCGICLPPVSVIGKAGYGERWRELNEEKVRRYNEARRQDDPSLIECRSCGGTFYRPPMARAVFCSKACEREHDNARRRKVAA